jgi:hypothetical protein
MRTIGGVALVAVAVAWLVTPIHRRPPARLAGEPA